MKVIFTPNYFRKSLVRSGKNRIFVRKQAYKIGYEDITTGAYTPRWQIHHCA